jgi:hypothetical protein
MKHRGIAVGYAVALAIYCPLLRSQSRVAPGPAISRYEPFRSFGLLDRQLTVLQSQQHSLQIALAKSESSTGQPPWAVAAGAIRKTAVSLEGITSHSQRLYRLRSRPYGVRLFRILQTRIENIRRGASAIESTPNRDVAKAGEQELNNQVLSLIVQFQAISGGYGATRCARRSWVCCEPKRRSDLAPGEEAACRWICVQRSQRCTGLLGPRIR